MEIFFAAFLLLGSFQMAWTLNITTCDCTQAEVMGLMDIQQPAYCDKKLKNLQPVVDKYEFYINEEPHATWKGHLCMAWLKERKVTGYFFGSYDTIDSMSIQTISEIECKKLVEVHDCDGNVMEETSPNLFSYKASPTGEGSWMSTVVYTIKNCIVQQISLKRDCLNCPITSPFGILTNNSDETSVITHDATIIWSTPKLNNDEKCSLKRVHKGTAVITKMENELFKLVDETNQLEFHYSPEVITMCEHKFHKLVNIDTAYIQLPDKTNKTWTHFFNKNSSNCLSYGSLAQEKCQSLIEQKFALLPNLIITTTTQNFCFTFTNQTFSRFNCDSPKVNINKLVWNPNTLQITDGKHCLKALNTTRVLATTCIENDQTQQWLPEVPIHEINNTDEENQPLLAQHHQFVEDKAVERANVLESEIKQIYCGNLQVRRYTTLMLAESNGLLAAMANNLPLCHRLKPNGKHLIVQKCITKNITITATQTKCGYEPQYQNFTIGRDGFSLHPFQECFWKDRIVNLNGQSYVWNNITQDWILEIPTYHLSTIKLTSKFNELADNEFQYTARHHKAYESSEYEQLNVMNELVTRIREENADSISSLVLNKKAESRFWNLSRWTTALKTIFVVAAVVAVLCVAAYIISCTARLRIKKHRNDMTDFAIRLQEARLRHPIRTDESNV